MFKLIFSLLLICLHGHQAIASCETSWKISNIKKISTGDNFVCAMGDSIECRGKKNKYGISEIPYLKQPKDLSSDGNGACAIDEEGLKCWGSMKYTSEVPQLKNPSEVSFKTPDALCVANNEEVECRAQKGGKIVLPFGIKHVSQLSLGGDYGSYFGSPRFGCGIVSGQLECWGDNYYGQTDAPQTSNPMAIAVGEKHSCVLDDSKVKCWGDWGTNGQTIVPKGLNSVTQLVAYPFETCALKSNGEISCWGMGSYLMPPKNLFAAKQVVIGRFFKCALGSDEVRCWGSGDSCPQF
ncbi:MAG: hypothetical protein JSU04_05135 [Bdellovibrionales bacterium]|nr:hypothetical protein [Bdellovibrionales bacterium]